jgi:hypothetical protein
MSKLADAKREADYLAITMWRRYYKDESPDFRLCDSVAGVITQIDNMSAGLGEKIEEQQTRIDNLEKALWICVSKLDEVENKKLITEAIDLLNTDQ